MNDESILYWSQAHHCEADPMCFVCRVVLDLRDARAALREIGERPCCGPNVSVPCYQFFGDDNRDKWCDSCIAFKAVEGGAT